MKTIQVILLIVASMFVQQLTYAQAWNQQGLDIDGVDVGTRSGNSVSMPDANTLAIGSPFANGNGTNSGNTRIYTWNDTLWTQKGADINGEAANDQSGFSVSMPDTNTVAIGAFLNDGTGTSAGHVRIYRWNGSAWTQKGLDIDGEAINDYSGYAVSMPDSNTVAIGAILSDGSGNDAGHVRIYTWNGSSWVQKGANINGESANDRSGSALSMPDSNTIAIGASFNGGNGVQSGHVRIYEWDGSSWIQKGLDIDGEAAFDESGDAISMPDVHTIAIGARLNDGSATNAGHVRIYQWDGSAWIQKGIDIDGEAVQTDFFGASVSMPDSNTVGIGAQLSNNGSAAYNDAGSVSIYAWDGSAWIQKGVNIDGEAAQDESGSSVSMPDANTIAIGAIKNDGNGLDSGHVRVFAAASTVNISERALPNIYIDVYPNPNQGNLNLNLGGLRDISIKVFDVTGRLVYQANNINAPVYKLALNGASGIYFVSVELPSGETQHLSLIKQ